MSRPSLRERLLTFITEQQPYASALVAAAWDRSAKREPTSADDVEKLRVPLARNLKSSFDGPKLPAGIETTPGITARERIQQAESALIAACDGFLRRESIERSLTNN